jgi:hypothetical protein
MPARHSHQRTFSDRRHEYKTLEIIFILLYDVLYLMRNFEFRDFSIFSWAVHSGKLIVIFSPRHQYGEYSGVRQNILSYAFIFLFSSSSSIALQPLWALASFQFPDLFIPIGRTPWTSDQLIARSLPIFFGRKMPINFAQRPPWGLRFFNVQ